MSSPGGRHPLTALSTAPTTQYPTNTQCIKAGPANITRLIRKDWNVQGMDPRPISSNASFYIN